MEKPKDWCATNVAVLGSSLSQIMFVLDSNPIRLARKSLGLTQEDMALIIAGRVAAMIANDPRAARALALPGDLELRGMIKATLAGLEAGLWRDAREAVAWPYISGVFAQGRFNVRDLQIQFIQWGQEVDKFLAEEAERLTRTGEAKPGPK